MRTKKEAIANIRTNTRIINGKPQQIFDCFIGKTIDGVIVKYSAVTKEALIDKIEEFFRKSKLQGEAAPLLKPRQIYDANEAFRILNDAGITKSLTSIVEEYIYEQSQQAKIDDISLVDAYNCYLKSFDSRQVEHLKTIRSRVGGFVQYVGANKLMSEITLDDALSYLNHAGRNSGKTYNNLLGYCSAFFSWATKRPQCYVRENILKDISRIKLEYKEPKFIRLNHAKTLFETLDARGDNALTAFATLIFFCGIRFAEIERMLLDKNAFVLEDYTIRIAKPKGFLRGMTPRIIRIPDNAMAWLTKTNAPKALLSKSPTILRNNLHALMAELNIPCPSNVARHSFITYHVAAYCEPSKTEAMAGTSSAMRVNSYMGLATSASGVEYFNIYPGHKNISGGMEL